ncbi:40S ribosomal protein S20 [Orobanche minor]
MEKLTKNSLDMEKLRRTVYASCEVLESLEVLRKKSNAQPEEVIPVEKLIAEAYSVIDKAVQVGTLHRNTGARRKSRLARRKKVVEIQRGWYTPEPAAAPTA